MFIVCVDGGICKCRFIHWWMCCVSRCTTWGHVQIPGSGWRGDAPPIMRSETGDRRDPGPHKNVHVHNDWTVQQSQGDRSNFTKYLRLFSQNLIRDRNCLYPIILTLVSCFLQITFCFKNVVFDSIRYKNFFVLV